MSAPEEIILWIISLNLLFEDNLKNEYLRVKEEKKKLKQRVIELQKTIIIFKRRWNKLLI